VAFKVEHIRFPASATELILDATGEWVGRLTIPCVADTTAPVSGATASAARKLCEVY